MAEFKIKLIDRRIVAQNTMAFSFSKPKDFNFAAGQYVLLTLPLMQDNGLVVNESRHLSIASIPHNDELTFIVRMRNTKYKEFLKNMPIGAECIIAGPSGKFVLPEDINKPLVFLAGGVGIVPVVSILRHLKHSGNVRTPVHVFYSNRRPEDAVYFDELESFSRVFNDYCFLPTMTRAPDWQGFKGRITGEFIKRDLGKIDPSSLFYVVGPEPMVAAVEGALKNELSINAEQIRTSKFCGYGNYICKACREKYGTAYQMHPS